MVSVAYYLSKRGNTEIMFHLCESSESHDFRNACLVSIIVKKNVCRSLSFNEIRQLGQPEKALQNRFSVV